MSRLVMSLLPQLKTLIGTEAIQKKATFLIRFFLSSKSELIYLKLSYHDVRLVVLVTLNLFHTHCRH